VRLTLDAEEGRLDAVVATMTGEARADVQRAIAAGKVHVDGEPRSKSFRLRGGERVTIEIEGDAPIAPEGPSVPIRYEDEHLVVIVKPAGVVTHPTAGRRDGTLVNRLLGMGVPLAPAGGSLRPGIVHRLDAGTSGLMVVAKTDPAYAALRSMFRAHTVQRAYLALVRGTVGHDAFAVDAPLGRRAAKVVVDATEGRRAETGFEVRERLAGATLLEAFPRTGRTHQIRVHLAAIGHPVLGDRAYGGRGDDARRVGLDRPFLHAWRLSFAHPMGDERVEIEEDLPEDLAAALARIR
jgi:23S rRNA pseudouridine1911/1915/1917 synthase